MYQQITKCRICGNTNLVPLLHLGELSLTGVFPKSTSEKISSGPLEVVKCHPERKDDQVCHLVQLHHSFNSHELYGANYGYRSGLNASMIRHLRSVVQKIIMFADLKKDDLIIDIGSNDSTLLQQYPADKGFILLGIDPTGKKFGKYYPSHIQLISDFFSADAVSRKLPGRKAKVITSIAMFYDLEDPLSFVRQIYDTLSDDGIWVFEQSYLLSMLETSSYDTICHEHLEYYSLSQIQYMMDRAGFRILDVELNEVNGGSFKVTVAKHNSKYVTRDSVRQCFAEEKKSGLETLRPYKVFAENIRTHRQELVSLIRGLRQSGKSIVGYGASTKGNVILQYCGLTKEDIPFIAEVNEDKFGSYTPFTHIPIIPEEEARAMKPDYFLVLPWHFRKGILEREKEFSESGGKFIFPLPNIEIVG
ncbi:MAG TPA: class I SAM-dependent methyltransferase [Chitinophagales bacterium]|nr:class I SAM-dependent methyltransferase [Chitinophagales bacterium]